MLYWRETVEPMPKPSERQSFSGSLRFLGKHCYGEKPRFTTQSHSRRYRPLPRPSGTVETSESSGRREGAALFGFGFGENQNFRRHRQPFAIGGGSKGPSQPQPQPKGFRRPERTQPPLQRHRGGRRPRRRSHIFR